MDFSGKARPRRLKWNGNTARTARVVWNEGWRGLRFWLQIWQHPYRILLIIIALRPDCKLVRVIFLILAFGKDFAEAVS